MELKFIHITKCAGSFIENIGIENNIKWGRQHKEYNLCNSKEHRTGQGFWHDSFYHKPEWLKKKYNWFVIVRNPYYRILSEFYCKWGGIGKKIVNYSKNGFNNFLINKIKNINKKGGHYTEQFRYYDKNYNIEIIKFENLDKELNDLFKKYNYDINLDDYPKVNMKSQGRNKLKFSIKDFNNELINLINEVYDEDFKLFDYEKIEK